METIKVSHIDTSTPYSINGKITFTLCKVLKILLVSKFTVMVYDHHNHYTVSTFYDYRPLEAFQKLFNQQIACNRYPHLFKFALLLICYNINIMIVGFNNLIYHMTQTFDGEILTNFTNFQQFVNIFPIKVFCLISYICTYR